MTPDDQVLVSERIAGAIRTLTGTGPAASDVLVLVGKRIAGAIQTLTGTEAVGL